MGFRFILARNQTRCVLSHLHTRRPRSAEIHSAEAPAASAGSVHAYRCGDSPSALRRNRSMPSDAIRRDAVNDAIRFLRVPYAVCDHIVHRLMADEKHEAPDDASLLEDHVAPPERDVLLEHRALRVAVAPLPRVAIGSHKRPRRCKNLHHPVEVLDSAFPDFHFLLPSVYSFNAVVRHPPCSQWPPGSFASRLPRRFLFHQAESLNLLRPPVQCSALIRLRVFRWTQ